MATLRYYRRRLNRLVSTPTFQLVSICLLLVVAVRWVLKHNHDDDIVGQVAHPVLSVEDSSIDWSKLYYVQYVTTPDYLCNALMIWSEIEEIGSRAQRQVELIARLAEASTDTVGRLLMYPSNWDINAIDDYNPAQDLTPIARLLQKAQQDYFVKLQPVDVLHQNSSAQETWADSYTKLLAFNLTSFDRVLALDSDGVVLQNLDALFLLPKAPLAMPYTYWGMPTGWQFSSQMLLLEPSSSTFEKVEHAIRNAKPDEYDMDILNTLFKGQILKIPQRPYNLLSGEFRRVNHAAYLSSSTYTKAQEQWNPDEILASAAYLHFSDWPIPKPWMRAPQTLLNKYMPKCRKSEWFGASDCRDREVWTKLYFDFALRRMTVCGMGFELQSQELPEDSVYRHGRWYHPDEVGS